MSEPRVSVVVPVRDRRELLLETLRGLSQQRFSDFEVVVVDDGSKDGSGEVAAGFGDLQIEVIRTAGVGAVAARCLGVAAASGEILAFTDSDCVPEEGWLAAGVAAIDKNADVVQGVTRPAGRSAPLDRSITHSGSEGLFATCNVFYRREAYERAGGFDGMAGDRLGFRAGDDGRALGFGEDTLLGWRVSRDGHSVVAPDAIVRHAVMKPSVRELLWRAWMTGGFAALVREAPELRATVLRQGIFLGYRRVPIYAMVGAAAIVPGRSRALAVAGACAWWAYARARRSLRFRGSVQQRLGAVPIEMAIDLVTAVSLVWGSARSRTLVL